MTQVPTKVVNTRLRTHGTEETTRTVVGVRKSTTVLDMQGTENAGRRRALFGNGRGNIYRNVDFVVDQDERRVNASSFRFGDGHGDGRLKRMKIQRF